MLVKSAKVFVMAILPVLAAPLALAEIPDLSLSTAVTETPGAVLFVRPDGMGDPFTMAHLSDGSIVDATITLTLVNFLSDPLPNYPAEDIWLEVGVPGIGDNLLAHPENGTIPDGPTDASGETHWIDPLEAGGCTIGHTAQVYVAGDALNQPELDIEFVSPDVNGDLLVNLADLTEFSGGYTSYEPCADMFFDGAMNLTDVSLFAAAYGF